jgi:hypothetical protein
MRLSLALIYYFLASIVCFFIIYLFASTKVELPDEYLTNHSKCSYKCTNYYAYSSKGLAGLYIVPSLFFVAQIITILGTHRNYMSLEAEKRVLRKIITVVMVVVSLILGLLVKKQLDTFSEIMNQVIVMLLLNLSILLVLLLPTVCLRKMDSDCDYDYISNS